MSKEKTKGLQVYADSIKSRLSREVPPKHKHRAFEYKQMLEIDLKKTLLKIEELLK